MLFSLVLKGTIFTACKVVKIVLLTHDKAVKVYVYLKHFPENEVFCSISCFSHVYLIYGETQ